MQVIARIRAAGLHADVKAFFTDSTLAGLAKTLRREAVEIDVPANLIPPGCQHITPEMLPLAKLTAQEIQHIAGAVSGGAENIQDIYALAPLQEGILFHHLLNKQGDVYLLKLQLSVDHQDKMQSFIQGLQAVIARHDSLRTSLVWEGFRTPCKWYGAPCSCVEELPLNPADGDIAAQLAERFDPAVYRIDLGQAPLLRVFTSEDSPNRRWVMHLLIHHVISDHITMEMLLEEILAHLSGQQQNLPTPLPYRNFVAHVRQPGREQIHQQFFKAMLADVDTPTLAYEVAAIQGDGRNCLIADLALDADFAGQIRACVRQYGVSAASFFHLAWAMVLARTAQTNDVVFGSVLFG